MNLRDLKPGDKFWFAICLDVQYEYRGEGWYGRPYCGGPWHDDGTNPEVIVDD